jgi:hypothetical protein
MADDEDRRSELRDPPSAPPSPLRDRPSGRRPWPR